MLDIYRERWDDVVPLVVKKISPAGLSCVHRVRITKPFYLGKYLVTQEQWEAVMGNNPSHFKGPKNPVETGQLGRLPAVPRQAQREVRPRGGKFQLPTEAQWEYACRAGSTTSTASATMRIELGEYAWYDKNSGNKTHPVARRSRTPGAVRHARERVGVVPGLVRTGIQGVARGRSDGCCKGSVRVLRGGGWFHPAWGCRSANRRERPGDAAGLGLRAARVPADKRQAR